MITIDEKQFIKASVVTLVIIGLIVTAGFSYKLYADTQAKVVLKDNVSGQKGSDTSDQSVINLVGKHIVLPNETPKVVTVKDVETLRKSEPFFNNATNGDKLLVYQNKVVLYSLILDKVVEVATIKLNK
jgi:hypothetical protein